MVFPVILVSQILSLVGRRLRIGGIGTLFRAGPERYWAKGGRLTDRP